MMDLERRRGDVGLARNPRVKGAVRLEEGSPLVERFASRVVLKLFRITTAADAI